ncbi:unnamed protein product [Ilex paraguariensis]|uniref:FLZ-type domain-containing protein n=1 Tax=Ilex paraguariensis TaxID=185542 RepID=A0ABC8TYH9_9AQUA
MLGKRRRPPMIRRTTSMTGITVDMPDVEAPPSLDHRDMIIGDVKKKLDGPDLERTMVGPSEYNHRSMALLSPRYHIKGSGDYSTETAHFLRTCGLCNRRLAPGRDIFMYRGDTAFCSLECREQQMKQDERKEKCRVAALKKAESQNK